MPEEEWTYIGLTSVEYQKGDLIGKVLAYSCLVPFFILSSLVTLIAFRRDLHTIFYLLGLLWNEVLNVILKNLIQEPRPGRGTERVLFDEFGMPSSHAQFMWFFGIYLSLFVIFRIKAIATETARDVIFRVLICLVSLGVAGVVCCGRLYLQYHTFSQIVGGAVVGSISGILWFLLVQMFITPLFPWMLRNNVAEWLMLRDLTPIPNVLWFEFVQARTEAKSRQRKSR